MTAVEIELNWDGAMADLVSNDPRIDPIIRQVVNESDDGQILRSRPFRWDYAKPIPMGEGSPGLSQPPSRVRMFHSTDLA